MPRVARGGNEPALTEGISVGLSSNCLLMLGNVDGIDLDSRHSHSDLIKISRSTTTNRSLGNTASDVDTADRANERNASFPTSHRRWHILTLWYLHPLHDQETIELPVDRLGPSPEWIPPCAMGKDEPCPSYEKGDDQPLVPLAPNRHHQSHALECQRRLCGGRHPTATGQSLEAQRVARRHSPSSMTRAPLPPSRWMATSG